MYLGKGDVGENALKLLMISRNESGRERDWESVSVVKEREGRWWQSQISITPPCSEEGGEMSESRYKEVESLLTMIRSGSSRHSEAAALFLDELAAMVSHGNLHNKVEVSVVSTKNEELMTEAKKKKEETEQMKLKWQTFTCIL